MSIRNGETSAISGMNPLTAYDPITYPATDYVPWTRNSNWLTLPTFSNNEQKFVGLVLIFNNDSNYVSVRCSGAYTVDWGNGVVENVASNTQRDHLYAWSSVSASTEFQLPSTTYTVRQAIVTITPQAGQNLTSVDLNVKSSLIAGQNWVENGWVDVAVNSPSLTSFGVATYGRNVEKVYIGQVAAGFTTFPQMPQLLRNLTLGFNTSQITSFGNAFNGCTVLTELPALDTSNCTNFSSMFSGCRSLRSVQALNTSKGTNFNLMFINCASLREVPPLDTSLATSMQEMFSGCIFLKTIPQLNTSNVTNFSFFARTCYRLQEAPFLNTSLGTTFESMFQDCRSIKSFPSYNTSSGTNFASMFNNCSRLERAPWLNTSNATTMLSMFSGCNGLLEVPDYDTSKVTRMDNMFNSCFVLQKAPNFNTSAVTRMDGMFSSCYGIEEYPLYDTSNCTSFSGFFYLSGGVKSIPAYDLSKNTTFFRYTFNSKGVLKLPSSMNLATVTNMQNFLNDAGAVTALPSFSNTTAVTDWGGSFQSSAVPIGPTLNTSGGTSFDGMFTNSFVREIPAYDLSNANSATAVRLVNGTQNLSRCQAFGMKYSISFGACKLSKTALEEIFGNLGIPVGAQTITITQNPGNITPVSLSGTTTAGSTTITMANTTGIVAGMQVTGVGTPLSTPIAVTFQDAGDTVTLTAHGLSNGDEVSFAAITSTTGIVINKIYYVVNAATDTFQVAETLGGAALALTTNGSGTLRYRAEVVSIVANTSVTISRKATSSGTNTLAYQNLRTGTALLKGWTVSQ